MSEWNSKLEQERSELLQRWMVFIKKRGTQEGQFTQIDRLVEIVKKRDNSADQNISSLLRQLHDKVGYKAKGNLEQGGLCSGAIFRTELFINTPDRIGSKKNGTIHIEHTIPICCLREQIKKFADTKGEKMLEWLLDHSVTTAFHISEQKFLQGYHRRTDAFQPRSEGFQMPFMRYKNLFDNGVKVWNVFDRIEVKKEMTFDEHSNVVRRLLAECTENVIT